ncbi:TPA: hypothetical protein RU600_001899 [Salmonella enterica]|nr:hypothetical protein [Salmonella enterica]HEA0390785.1 hypothetical protein [Salmonella enterica]
MNKNNIHSQLQNIKGTTCTGVAPECGQSVGTGETEKKRNAETSDMAPGPHESNPSIHSVQSDTDFTTEAMNKSNQEWKKANKKNKLTPSDFKWLKGRENERAIFWVWLLLRWLPVKNNINPVPITKKDSIGWHVNICGDIIIYDFFGLPKETGSTKERSRIIINFFYTLEKHSNPADARRLLENIRSIWMNLIYPVRNVVWLNKKSESELDEIWDYLLKRKELSSCILNWFKPVDNNERRLGIIGAIDSFYCYCDPRDTLIKKDILNSAYKNFLQTRRREKIATGNKKAGLNAEISKKSKSALIKMAEIKGIRINKLIEKIILDEYSRFNSKD